MNDKPEILKKILSLEGRWVANANMRMGGQEYNFKYTMDFKKVSDGNGLIMEESGDIPPVASLRGTNVIGFDPYTGLLNWFSVDNLGTTHNHTAEKLNGNKLQLLHESQKDKKPFKEVIDVTFLDENSFQVRLIGTLGGETETELFGTFIRKK